MQVAVIGAGIVGLSCAAALARDGHAVVVIERHPRPGQETSSRSSEVIHAGLYYPPGSLKALTCARGRGLLYEHCAKHHVRHRKIGKLVVAVDEGELPALERLHERGLANGAGALSLLDERALAVREPRVRARAALWSPETGIVDSHALMTSLVAQARAHGAELAFRTTVLAFEGGELVVGDARGEVARIAFDFVVNAAGLSADRMATLAGVDVDARALRIHPCKGDYFTLAPRLAGLTRHLVYPMAETAGLGIHITHDLAGGLRAGPDAEYVAAPFYDVSVDKRARFGAALRRYLPEVEDEDLSPAYAGVRPKLAGPGVPFRDFVCEVFPEAPRVVQLVGIESPGLTSALALAELVSERLAAE